MERSKAASVPETAPTREMWTSRIGLILAMAGNAVGLGNFLRFPRQAAVNGGGAFMITYFVALLLLGIPLMWIEWGLGRHGGRVGKGHIPGMFASIWKHPAAKYVGVVGLVVPLAVFTYYTYIESWTLAFTLFSVTKGYWGRLTEPAMVGYLQSFQGIGTEHLFAWWVPYAFFAVTLTVNIWVVSRGISRGIEKLARIGMPILFLFAAVLAVVVLTQHGVPGGGSPAKGLEFIYGPDLHQLTHASVWLASAGQIFFTLSVGMGTLQAYASYLSDKDDIALSGLATAATNETAEVVLGGTIAIPAAVTFFGVSGAMAIAQSGSFNLGFATMPVIFQKMPFGHLLGFMWFGLLFFAGITSSVAMATPILAFFREEFHVKRERVAAALGGVVFLLGLMHVAWLGHGFLDEWDYWAGTFGLVLFSVAEVVIFVWVFGPRNAWASIHLGAEIRIPEIFRWIMTIATPAYLLIILGWWSVTDAVPILEMKKAAGGGLPPTGSEGYILASRLVLVGLAVGFVVLVRAAWKRNGYDDRRGFDVPAPDGGPTGSITQEG
ncbi:MAG TPA: sodium-dependent transporter [Longimicrobiales bacterium]|nr:sodium-dependent transporter [Longimicrobiales bacterium]